jgi:large subunit ribosomal protein L3
MGIELTCKKLGMTRAYNEDGISVPVTVLEAEGNIVVQKKTEETDGYNALQVGSGSRRDKTITKGLKGHYTKAGIEGTPRRTSESRVSAEAVAEYEVGQGIDVTIFEEGQKVDVIGTSRGRGFAGGVKRHGHHMPEATHGTHEHFRHSGSIGAGAYPGRVIKGMKMPGQMGNTRVTTRNLVVVKVDAEQGLLFVCGGVPGHNKGTVRVRSAESTRKA